MKALILHSANHLSIDDIDIREELGPDDVRIAIRTVGICGSDVHYYRSGRIGDFIVTGPMVLGHEGAGTVIEAGGSVKNLKPGDRVCMEPGIPDLSSRATREGIYNLDPAMKFWATPPVHGCLREMVVHPAMFTYKLPENIGYDEGALIEPLSVGMQAVTKAKIRPGDTALVIGCGTVGLLIGLVALAAGCGRVIISDIIDEKLSLAEDFGMTPVNFRKVDLKETVSEMTEGWGANVIFECSGNADAIGDIFTSLCPGGIVVFIGMPLAPVPVDIIAALSREARMESVFRYAHQYPRALTLVASGKLNVKPLITDRYKFTDAIKAFEYAANPEPHSVKTVIEL